MPAYLSEPLLYLGSLVLAFLLAYLCAAIAARKGRSILLWAILGLVFPFLALFLILILPSAADNLTTRGVYTGPGAPMPRICPSCRKAYKAGTMACQACGVATV